MQELAPQATERNYRKDPFTKSELTALVRTVNNVASIVNSRHATAKANGWDKEAPSEAEFIDAALEEWNLLRRPIIQKGKRAIYSRSESEIRTFLG